MGSMVFRHASSAVDSTFCLRQWSASKNRISILRLFKSTSDSGRHPKQWSVESRYKCHRCESEAWQPMTEMAISFQALSDPSCTFQPLRKAILFSSTFAKKKLDSDYPLLLDRSLFPPLSSSKSPTFPPFFLLLLRLPRPSPLPVPNPIHPAKFPNIQSPASD